MARVMRMPSKNELAEGPHREFVEELRRYYRAAGRPSLREVSRAIEGRAELKEVTASQETVRRMLRGMTLPTDWDRVYAVFFVLCEVGSIDPEADRWDGYGNSVSNCEHLKGLWDAALEEEPDLPSIPRAAPPRQAPSQGFSEPDPWAASEPVGFSDEPPF